MIRIGIIYKDGTIKGKTVKNWDEAETYVLKECETNIKRADGNNLKTGERRTLWQEN